MPKPKNFPEEMLDFAQSYLASAIMLLDNSGKTFPFPSIINFEKGNVLCAHFLMAHGLELYFKFLIKLLGGTPSTREHDLISLLNVANGLWSKHYKRPILNQLENKLVQKLNRNLKFRYAVDKNLNVIPDMFKEAEKWKSNRIKTLMQRWNQILKKLNDCGYRYTTKINKKI